MKIIVAVLLLAGFGLGLVLCLLKVLRDLLELGVQDAPVFQDASFFRDSRPVLRDSEPIFHDQGAHQHQARSQFAWQSRSHFRAPD
jgi:hypothetical protein